MWKNTYQGKKVLITGHTGFKGSWLTLWLKELGAQVCGYALAPNTRPALFDAAQVSDGIVNVFEDILDTEKLNKTFQEFQPEIVFHLAAQPLVRLSYAEPVMTYQTNVIGTLNVLEAARKTASVKAFVNVTTDKCYENKEINRGYKEDEPMGGYDMYSSSKGCVEILSSSYRRSFLQNGYAMATARAGNVIGGGDWAADRLIPDCVRAIEAKEEIEIRNPIATRPWQHVLEPLSGYLLLGHLLYTQGQKYAEGFNLGPNADSVLSVADVAQLAVKEYGRGSVKIHKRDDLHEANLLMLDITKAKEILGWEPTYTAQEAVAKTIDWYKRFYQAEPMLPFTLHQIHEYEERIVWKKN
ncbi:CDP-glucose 4,6-dehydratase [Candidatus Avelusimicrobium sp.]